MTAPSTTNSTNNSSLESPSISSSSPEYVAVILCGTAGARMFPLSAEPSDLDEFEIDSDDEFVQVQDTPSDANIDDNVDANDEKEAYKPKFLLPVAGMPILHRLLFHLLHARFQKCVIACSHLDKGLTLESIQSNPNVTSIKTDVYKETGQAILQLQFHPDSKLKSTKTKSNPTFNTMHLTILDLPPTCEGSCDALQYICKNQLAHHPTSHVVVLPSDLILDDATNGLRQKENKEGDILTSLVNTHRQGYEESNVAVTMLMSDVGDEDEQGLPLKESAKQKKGGLARDEEDIEYIALSSTNSPSIAPRIILKRSKIDVEENEDNDGNTPKLIFPKYRVRDTKTTNTITTLTTDLSDLHVFVFSPWVVQHLIQMRTGINSIQGELLPLLISRQFRGVEAAFGKKCLSINENERSFQSIISSFPFNNTKFSKKKKSPPIPFYCAVHMLPRRNNTSHPRLLTLRACTVPSYLYTCRELLMNTIQRLNTAPPSTNTNNKPNVKIDHSRNKLLAPALSLPEGFQIQAKFSSLILSNTSIGEKLKLQNSTIGSNCTIGAKCKLNNVVIMDNAVIGENCTLQNSVIGTGVVLGENCSLNDCQIGHGVEMSKGTKLKGESITNKDHKAN